MIIEKDQITFEKHDMNFVAKFGILEACDIVLDFKSQHNLPFIYDTYQLAHFLCVGRKDLFDFVKSCDSMYIPITIPKKSGGCRCLSVPDSTLENIQRIILKRILNQISISKYSTAYHKGAKLTDNAAPHVGKRFILKMDLTDFFSSIRFDKVYSCAFNANYFPKQIGVMLTALCCKDDVLPQGAPTSPAISNIVMKNFDDNFGAWCEKRGFSYTRYCDDITVSGNTSLYPAYRKAKAWLENMSFEINERKTRFITNASRQTVTGLTVNEKVSVPSDYKRKLRQEVYYACKFGLESAILHKSLTEFMISGISDTFKYFSYLIGKINYVLSVEPENAYFQNALYSLKQLPKAETNFRLLCFLGYNNK